MNITKYKFTLTILIEINGSKIEYHQILKIKVFKNRGYNFMTWNDFSLNVPMQKISDDRRLLGEEPKDVKGKRSPPWI